jgi:hypothetical protein
MDRRHFLKVGSVALAAPMFFPRRNLAQAAVG